MPRGGSDGAGMVDAERFLALRRRLEVAHKRIDGSDVPDHRRGSWTRRIVAIAETAQGDLDRAERQLERLEADLDRHLQ